MDIQELTQEHKEMLMLYAMYTISYINDTACFSIQQLNKDVMSKDKESKKIYGALLKRCSSYLNDLDEAIGDKIDTFCAYNETMDDICDDVYFDFRQTLMNAYKESQMDDYEYLAKVETMRTIVGLSVDICRDISTSIKQYIPEGDVFMNHALLDIQRVANNFARWSYRKIPSDIKVNVGKGSETSKKLDMFNRLIVDWKSFDKAYKNSQQ